MLKKIIALLVPCILFSCISYGIYLDYKSVEAYKEIQGLYRLDFTSHLPHLKVGDNALNFHLRFPRGAYMNGVDILMPQSRKEIDSIRTFAEKEAVKKYRFTEENLVIVENAPSNDDASSVVKMRRCTNCPERLPIPNFDYYNLLDNENAVIYVLGAEKGKFLEESHLTRYKMELPDDWQHGYSRGIVISKNKVAYWLSVW